MKKLDSITLKNWNKGTGIASWLGVDGAETSVQVRRLTKTSHYESKRILSFYEYINKIDILQLFPKCIGYMETDLALVFDIEGESTCNLTADNLHKFVASAIQTISFMHNAGWSGVCFDFTKTGFYPGSSSFKLKDLENLSALGSIQNEGAFGQIISDYSYLLKTVQSTGLHEDEIMIPAVNKLNDLVVSERGTFYDCLKELFELYGLDVSLFVKRPLFYSYVERKTHLDAVGVASYSMVRGYSGSGKTTILQNILSNLDKGNVIYYKPTFDKNISSGVTFLAVFNDWLSGLTDYKGNKQMEACVRFFVEQNAGIEKHLTYLNEYYENDIVQKRTTSKEDINYASAFFKSSLLRLLEQISRVINEKIYIVIDDFNFSPKLTCDLIEFYNEHGDSDSVKWVLCFKEDIKSFHSNTALVLKAIESRGKSVEKTTVQPLNLSEMVGFLDTNIPSFLRDRVSAEYILQISSGNFLFAKALLNAAVNEKDEGQLEFSDAILLNMADSVSQYDNYKLMCVLAIYGKPLAKKWASDIVNSIEASINFDLCLLELLSSGLVVENDGEVSFAHEKFAELTHDVMDQDTMALYNSKILDFLLDFKDKAGADSERLMFDVGYHATKALDYKVDANNAYKLSTICFAASLKAKEFGAFHEAKTFIEKSISSIKIAEKQGVEVDQNYKYAIRLKYAKISYETGAMEEAEKQYNDLLDFAVSDIDKLEALLGLVIVSVNSGNHKLRSIVTKLAHQNDMTGLWPDGTVELRRVSTLISRQLGVVKTDNIIGAAYSLDNKEIILQQILSEIVYSLMHKNHHLMMWAGLQLFHRSITVGKTEFSDIGAILYSYYLKATMKDQIGSSIYNDLSKEMNARNESSVGFRKCLRLCLMPEYSSHVQDISSELDSLINDSIKNESVNAFENYSISRHIMDFCRGELLSTQRDRIFLHEHLSARLNKSEKYTHFVEVLKRGLNLNSGEKVSDIREELGNKYNYVYPFISSFSKIIELKNSFLSGDFPNLERLEVDERTVIGGTRLEPEYLFWNFCHWFMISLIGKQDQMTAKDTQAKYQLYANKIALLTRNGSDVYQFRYDFVKALKRISDIQRFSDVSEKYLKDVYDLLGEGKAGENSVHQLVMLLLLSKVADYSSNEKLCKQFVENALEVSVSSHIKPQKLLSVLYNSDAKSPKSSKMSGESKKPLDKDTKNNIDASVVSESIKEKPTVTIVEKSDQGVDSKPKAEIGLTNNTKNQNLSNAELDNKIKSVRSELISHLFELDGAIIDDHTGDILLRRFVLTSKFYFMPFGISFSQEHYGDDLSGVILDPKDLNDIFLSYENLIVDAELEVKLETAVDDVSKESIVLLFNLIGSEKTIDELQSRIGNNRKSYPNFKRVSSVLARFEFVVRIAEDRIEKSS